MRAEGFFCNLDVLYGGLGIGKLQFLIKKKFNFFSSCNFFFKFWSLKPWIRIGSGSGSIRIGIQPKMLDPDEMNADPQPWWSYSNALKRFAAVLFIFNKKVSKLGVTE